MRFARPASSAGRRDLRKLNERALLANQPVGRPRGRQARRLAAGSFALAPERAGRQISLSETGQRRRTIKTAMRMQRIQSSGRLIKLALSLYANTHNAVLCVILKSFRGGTAAANNKDNNL
jgi:hypothetical protein